MVTLGMDKYKHNIRILGFDVNIYGLPIFRHSILMVLFTKQESKVQFHLDTVFVGSSPNQLLRQNEKSTL